MADFSSRRLRGSGTLGERLRKMREERRLAVGSISAALNIQEKYLTAIEEGRYLDLPSDVYVKNFIRLYAEYLGANASTALHIYEQERKVFTSQQTRRARSELEKEKRIPKAIITPRRLRQAAVIIAILAVLFYLGLEARRITAPPFLEVTSPANDVRTAEQLIRIAGQTEPEVAVFINGEEVIPDAQGFFEEDVRLSEGLNTIEVLARKSRGREQRVVRQILVEQSP